jgi:chaperonin GroES
MNNSGVQPLDLRVLVKPDSVEVVSKGGIILPPTATEADKFAMTKGTLVAVGENAWEEAASRSPHFRKPTTGDRVMIGKFAGVRLRGVDGEDYVLMNDEDVIGRLEE